MTDRVASALFEGPRAQSEQPPLTANPVVSLVGYVRAHRKYVALTFFFGVVGFLLSFAYPWLIGNVVDLVTAPAGTSLGMSARRLVRLTELAAATAVLHAAVVYGRGHFNVHLGDGVVNDIRRAVFKHLQGLSLRFFATERTGAILGRILHDVDEAASVIYVGVIVAAMDAVQLLIALALLVEISPKLTLACIVFFPLYAVVFALRNPEVRRASERLRAHLSFMSANVNERLAGQAVIKTYTAEAREARRFSEELTEHHDLVLAQSHHGHLVAAAGEVLVHAGTTVVVGYGGWLALHGQMTAGTMTRFLGYVLLMFGPVRRFAELNVAYQQSVSAIRRVFRVLEIRPAVVECARPRLDPPARGHVRLEGVRFRFHDTSDETRFHIEEDTARAPEPKSPWVLRDVDLEARPGQQVAIVGRSGAGKTTLVSLVPRLYDATAGRVLVDGVDVRDYGLHALRSKIAIVQQDPFLFSGTIRENLAYARPNASDDEIGEAAAAAYAHDFIMELPEGYASRLGERGVNLSGGQRQRLSIARALLKNPAILILDEATSALDTESESIAQRAFDTVMRSRTCLIIAHRLSTIKNADKIYVLDRGRTMECGTHDELLSRGGVYEALVRHQTRLG